SLCAAVRARQPDHGEHVGRVGRALEPAELPEHSVVGRREPVAGEALDLATFAGHELPREPLRLELAEHVEDRLVLALAGDRVHRSDRTLGMVAITSPRDTCGARPFIKALTCYDEAREPTTTRSRVASSLPFAVRARVRGDPPPQHAAGAQTNRNTKASFLAIHLRDARRRPRSPRPPRARPRH